MEYEEGQSKRVRNEQKSGLELWWTYRIHDQLALDSLAGRVDVNGEASGRTIWAASAALEACTCATPLPIGTEFTAIEAGDSNGAGVIGS